jgi:hypothetical protein
MIWPELPPWRPSGEAPAYCRAVDSPPPSAASVTKPQQREAPAPSAVRPVSVRQPESPIRGSMQERICAPPLSRLSAAILASRGLQVAEPERRLLLVLHPVSHGARVTRGQSLGFPPAPGVERRTRYGTRDIRCVQSRRASNRGCATICARTAAQRVRKSESPFAPLTQQSANSRCFCDLAHPLPGLRCGRISVQRLFGLRAHCAGRTSWWPFTKATPHG